MHCELEKFAANCKAILDPDSRIRSDIGGVFWTPGSKIGPRRFKADEKNRRRIPKAIFDPEFEKARLILEAFSKGRLEKVAK